MDAPKPNPVLAGSCANCGMTMNDAYIPPPRRNATRFVVHTPRMRIIDMSISGSRLRTSTATHAVHTARPMAKSTIVFVPPQPQTDVWAIAIRMQQIPVLINAAASQFTWPGERTGDSGMKRHVQKAASRVTTSGAQNSQCQLRCSTMTAPSTSPAPPPIPSTEESTPMLPATRSGGNSSRAIENESGKIPPATPWITRATISSASVLDTAASSVPAESTSSVYSSSRSLPYMSPSRPMIAVPTDADSRKPVSTQVTPVSVVWRSCWIVGSAGITAELSTA
jgi:hypothetical protein